jgi:hypothetical protein
VPKPFPDLASGPGNHSYDQAFALTSARTFGLRSSLSSHMLDAIPRVSDRVCFSEPSAAICAYKGTSACVQPGRAPRVASRSHHCALALAVLPDPYSPGWTMVDRPQFLPRLLRTHVLGFRDLAGAFPPRYPETQPLLVGPSLPRARTMRSHCRSDGC